MVQTMIPTLLNNRRPVKIDITADDIVVTLSDGSKVANPLNWHWWLADTTPAERGEPMFYADSVEFPDIDGGLDIEGMLRGIPSKRPKILAK